MAEPVFEGLAGHARAAAHAPAGMAGSVVAREHLEDALIGLAVKGDRDAFEALVASSIDRSYHLALGILGNDADARDAVQDAYLSVWRNLSGLRDARCFEGWLTRIVINACRGVGRRRRRLWVREIRVEAVPEDDLVVDGSGSPTDAASLDALERAFDRLAPDERSILVLHHLEHRSVAEIATALAIPVGTAKSRLHTARRALERALERER